MLRLITTLCIISLTLGLANGIDDDDNPVYKDIERHMKSTKQDLECHVCNSKLGACDKKDLGESGIKCSNMYTKTVYGLEDSLPTTPLSFGDGGGWYLGSASTYGKGDSSNYSRNASYTSGYKTSGFLSLYEEKPNGKYFENGFKTCRTMKISVEDQSNDGKRRELKATHPRIIRTCSFRDKEGCETINYRTATVTACYCKANNCNQSWNLRASHWTLISLLIGLFSPVYFL